MKQSKHHWDLPTIRLFRAALARLTESIKTRGLTRSGALCLRLLLFPVLRSRVYQGWCFDLRFGVDTSDWSKHPTPSIAGGVAALGKPYHGTSPALFRHIIRGLEIRYEDFSFVDFGSGKGRALLLASAFPFRSVSGVEWDSELDDVTKRNIQVYCGPRECQQIKSCCGDASEFPVPDGKSVLYFFNPFSDEIMRRVAENLRKSFDANPRDIIVVYVRPKGRSIFDEAHFLKRVTDRRRFVVYQTLAPHALSHAGAAVADPALGFPPAA